ncbi:MAG: CoA ester lyase [Gemmatimonadaceae bacterium]|nr:CoA ester lyase [Gemmatimonadaceae bacterium]
MIVRTLLFVPGDRPERFDKAAASGADAIVLDLEDAVAASNKVLARESVVAWLRNAVVTDGPLRIVRVNARGTPWFEDDVSALRDIGVHGVMLPKCEQPFDLDTLPDVGLWPLIESARGLANATAIGAVPGVQQLVFGSLDFQLDLGIESDADETELAPYRAQLVLASRLAGLAAPVDGVTIALNDDAALANATRRAMREGFGAKLCIHPRQVPVVHAAMHPGAVAIAHARRVLEAAAAADGAAVAVDGMMVDRPVIRRAQSVLARAERAVGPDGTGA